ncbi:hypothetical protein PR048_031325 [Dryococelus australis]|uniref:Uncharacterized protein n=1 Tax=Dryococelus australis TaxID=614101 RepID=A0ABQ9G810_9NEOP|nr:hypothetical protein PR048_031325 [Dryococelus australis]
MDFRMWESCRTMSLVGPVSSRISRFSLIPFLSRDLDVKRRPNLFTHSRNQMRHSTKYCSANWVLFRAGSFPDFRTCKWCRTMSLVSEFDWGSPVSPLLHSSVAPFSPQFAFIGSQDVDASAVELRNRKSRGDPKKNLTTHINLQGRDGHEIHITFSYDPLSKILCPHEVRLLSSGQRIKKKWRWVCPAIVTFIPESASGNLNKVGDENTARQFRAWRLAAMAPLMRVGESPLSPPRFSASNAEENFNAGMKWAGGKGRSPRKRRRPAASSGTISTRENSGVTRPETEIWSALVGGVAVYPLGQGDWKVGARVGGTTSESVDVASVADDRRRRGPGGGWSNLIEDPRRGRSGHLSVWSTTSVDAVGRERRHASHVADDKAPFRPRLMTTRVLSRLGRGL